MWLHQTEEFRPHHNQGIEMEKTANQNRPLKILAPSLHDKNDVLSSSGQNEKSSESPKKLSDSALISTGWKSEVKEEKIVIENVRSLAKKVDTTDDFIADDKLKICEEEDGSSERAGEVIKESGLKSEDVSEIPSDSRGGICNGSVSDENAEKTKYLKKKTSKDTQRQTDQELLGSPEQNSLDGTRSPPISPLNESAEKSRRTRCSFNPNFAEKQKKFLAMVSSSSWDDDESHDGDYYEHSFKTESKNGFTNDEVDINLNGKNNDVNGKQLIRRRRPTKETVQRKSSEALRRKSARFDLPSETKAVKISENVDEDTHIIDDKDRFCWACHRVDKHHPSIQCVTCPRVYHRCCVRGQCESAEKDSWSCPECTLCLKMESFESQSESMKLISADEFCLLLTKTVEFLSSLPGAEVFREPVDLTAFPDYRDYIVNPVHLKKIQANIDKKLYGSTESFIADVKWLYHNSIIFNGLNSGLTSVAKSILVRCKSKMNQLERCVDCFKQSFDVNISESFLEACRQPHLLVWAKFKGYPFWPSKVFHWKMDNKNNYIVEVKFFNDYSRAWVPSKFIYLFSKKSPSEVSLPNSKDFKSYQNALSEAQKHISNLEDSFGTFVYAPAKTEFDPEKYNEHLKAMLPKYDPLALQARNTIILSASSTKRETSSDQDFKNKKLVDPESLKKEPNYLDVEISDSESEENVKKPLKKVRIKESDLKPEDVEKKPLKRVRAKESDGELGESMKKRLKKVRVRESDIKHKDSKKKRSKEVKLRIRESDFETEEERSEKRPRMRVNKKDPPSSMDSHSSVESNSNLLTKRVAKFEDEKNSEATFNTVENSASFSDFEDDTADSVGYTNRGLSELAEDSIVPKKMFLLDALEPSKTSSELSKILLSKDTGVRGQKSSNSELSSSSSHSASVDETNVKKKNLEHSGGIAMQDKYPNLANEYGSVAAQTDTKFEERVQNMSKKDSSLNALLTEKSFPAIRKSRASGSGDSSRTSSSESDDLVFSSMSDRPIGMETEARSLRVNPVAFDHEGSATRLFNFSVQQLVPFVSEALNSMMNKLASTGNKDALIQVLRLQLEEIQQKHMQEISSLKHIMNQQFLEYAYASDIFKKQAEQKFANRVAELEELLKKEKENVRAERETWIEEVSKLSSIVQELRSLNET